MTPTLESDGPRVGIITPVYNGAPYIRECIESVLSQTYANWRYLIFDNQSTDDTFAIASQYAARDSRIRVLRNDVFLPVCDNWNKALSYLDPDAVYFKMIHADDWIYPDCLAEMVSLAVQHPTVGIVGAFRLEETKPSLGGLPVGQSVTPGLEICRQVLNEGLRILGSPSNIMMRADLVRKYVPFYDKAYVHDDYEACLRVLRDSDFGFVFKVLTFTRRHNESQTSRLKLLGTFPSEDLLIFAQHGPACFAPAEFERLMKRRVRAHYRFLGRALLESRGREFWPYQMSTLRKLGLSLDYPALAYSTLLALLDIPATLRRLRRRPAD